MNSEVKEIFISHARQLPKRQFFDLYKGVLPISTIYRWYGEIDFNNKHHIRYSYKALQEEWDRIKKIDRGYIASPVTNKIVLHFQQHFYDAERELLKNSEVKQKLLDNREKYLNKPASKISTRELLLGFKVSGTYRGYSHFSPYWIKRFLIQHNSKAVYDPTGGWGHRLLGACSLSAVHYYYNDYWEKSASGALSIKQFLNLDNCTIINDRSERLVPDFSYDTVFTCPPYYNKECYNSSVFSSLEDFKQWWKSTVNCFVNDNLKTVGICIDRENVGHISKPILDRGFVLKEALPLGPKRKMHYQKTDNDTRDLLLTFSKCY